MLKKFIIVILASITSAWGMSPPNEELQDAVASHDITRALTLFTPDTTLDPNFIAQCFLDNEELSIFQDYFFKDIIIYFSCRHGWESYGEKIEKKINESSVPHKKDLQSNIKHFKKTVNYTREDIIGEHFEEECTKLYLKALIDSKEIQQKFLHPEWPRSRIANGNPPPPPEQQGDGGQQAPQPIQPQQTAPAQPVPQATPDTNNTSSVSNISPTITVTNNHPMNFNIYLFPNPFKSIAEHVGPYSKKGATIVLVSLIALYIYLFDDFIHRDAFLGDVRNWAGWNNLSDRTLSTISSEEFGPLLEKYIRWKYKDFKGYGDTYIFSLFFKKANAEIEQIQYFIEYSKNLESWHLGFFFRINPERREEAALRIAKLQRMKKLFGAWLKENKPNIASFHPLVELIEQS